jgi:hypothetical protein
MIPLVIHRSSLQKKAKVSQSIMIKNSKVRAALNEKENVVDWHSSESVKSARQQFVVSVPGRCRRRTPANSSAPVEGILRPGITAPWLIHAKGCRPETVSIYSRFSARLADFSSEPAEDEKADSSSVNLMTCFAPFDISEE